MAWLKCHTFSETLGLSVTLNALLPDPSMSGQTASARKKPPVLYLLHGLGDDSTVWIRRTAIEQEAVARGLAVIMPEAGRSYYTDMLHGLKYWTFISEELPFLAQSLFPITSERAHTAVAGISMGGYGAFKWALRRPEMFGAAISLSGALDPAGGFAAGPPDYKQVFGSADRIAGTEDDLFELAGRLASSGLPHPALYQVCGTDDARHLELNRRFRDHCLSLDLPLVYEEGSGFHDWSFWNSQLGRALSWLADRHGSMEAISS